MLLVLFLQLQVTMFGKLLNSGTHHKRIKLTAVKNGLQNQPNSFNLGTCHLPLQVQKTGELIFPCNRQQMGWKRSELE